tara:strand:- start:11840 stop:13465 length:1626 start_codon:yes stop_codon:yes gene_type:complete
MSTPIKAEQTRSVDDGQLQSKSGPYLARVLKHADPLYLGGLEVELLKVSEAGTAGETLGQTAIVYYASPFYGVTGAQHLGKNDTYSNTQKSYGFWAIPPDPGTLVLCTFVEGSREFGYWFGCVPERGMTFMLPGGQPGTEQTSGNIPKELKGKKLPVGEYNKKTTKLQTNNAVKYKRPVNEDFIEQLKEQGLVEDDIRGTTTSSAQREFPSAVFGISSPGPIDKRGGSPQGKIGIKESKATVHVSRLGSSSFVIDDGDDKLLREGSPEDTPYKYINKEASEQGGDVLRPANEMIRLRTRTGAQIMMNTSEDLIYINNSRGTAWIEMSSNGKLDVYAKDSISFHTETDFNFVADRDINFEAGRNVNMIVNNNINLSCALDYHLLVGQDGYIKAKNNLETTVTNDSKTTVLNNQETLVSNSILTTATDGSMSLFAGEDMKIQATGSSNIKSSYHKETADRIDMNTSDAAEADLATEATLPVKSAFPFRVPQHEPWQGHESWNPEETAPDKTEATLEESQDVHMEERPIQTDRTAMNGLTPEEE